MKRYIALLISGVFAFQSCVFANEIVINDSMSVAEYEEEPDSQQDEEYIDLDDHNSFIETEKVDNLDEDIMYPGLFVLSDEEDGNYELMDGLEEQSKGESLQEDDSTEVLEEETEEILNTEVLEPEVLSAAEMGDDGSSGSCGEALSWHIEDDTLFIEGEGDMDDYEIGSAPWYQYKDVIESVVIEEGAVSIGNAAFYALSHIPVMNLPNSITRIGENAFADCTSLTEIVLSDEVTEIEYRAFYNCASLVSMQTDSSMNPAHTHETLVIPAVPATCTTSGLTEGQVCSRCGETLVEQTTIPALNHEWGEGETTKEPTCTMNGTMTYTCGRCGVKRTETIEMTGHTPVTDTAIVATCITAGKTEGSHCSVCGTVLTPQTDIAAFGHAWDEGVVTTQPTCTENGKKTFACKNNPSHTKTEQVEALGHNLTHVEAKEATCETSGNIEYWYCDRCGKFFRDAENSIAIEESATAVAAIGHSWDEGVVTTQPKCTEAGKKTFTCTNDPSHTRMEPVEALGHNLMHVEAKPATDEENGNIEYWQCALCGKLFLDSEGATETDEATVTIAAYGNNQGGTTDQGIVWSIENGILTIRAQNQDQSSEIRDYAESESAEWTAASKALNISVIVVAEGITRVGANAFAGLDSVTQIKLPASLKEIDENSVDSAQRNSVQISYAGTQAEWNAMTAGTALQDVKMESTHVHIWDAGKITRAATTTSAGVKTYTCTICKETKTENIAKLKPQKPAEKITISKKPSIKKPAAAKGKITVKWKHFKHTSKNTKKIWKKIKKVQIQCATDKTFKNKVKDVKIGRGKTKYAIKGLKKKTTYYVRVRYYDGTGYSAWSKVKKVKTK